MGADEAESHDVRPSEPPTAPDPKRLAVVVVHGIADQKRGETVEAFVNKLTEASVFAGAAKQETRWLPSAKLSKKIQPRAGDRFDALLVEGLHVSDAAEAARSFPVVVQSTRAAAHPVQLDVFELFWADLSRPRDSLLGILTALAGLFVTVPRLGAAGLRQASRSLESDNAAREQQKPPLPRHHTFLLRLAEAAFGISSFAVIAFVLAPFFFGVSLALSLVAIETARHEPQGIRLAASAIVACVITGVAYLARRLTTIPPRDRPNLIWTAPYGVAALVAVVTATIHVFLPGIALPIVITGIVAGVALGATLVFAGTQRSWLVALGVVFGVTGVILAVACPLAWGNDVAPVAQGLVDVLPLAIELAYAATTSAFCAVLVLVLAGASAGYVGVVLVRGPDRLRVRHAVSTALLTQVLPLLGLLTVALPIVAALSYLLSEEDLLPQIDWVPRVLGSLLCYLPEGSGEGPPALELFLECLVRAAGTRALVFVLGVLGVLALLVLWVVLPVAVGALGTRRALRAKAEDDDVTKDALVRTQSAELDHWLDRGTTALANATLLAAVTGSLLILGGFLLELWAHWAIAHGAARSPLEEIPIIRVLDEESGNIIVVLGGVLAGGATLLAFPGRLRELLSPVWPVVDILVDVAAYTQPKIRATILARAHGLLQHVDAAGYDAVLVVCHSQGTLITCDALRTLPPRTRDHYLLTMGSPLANLYWRFLPYLFLWVEDATGRANEWLQVVWWRNVYGAADYVGRTLRSTVAQRALSKRTQRDAQGGKQVQGGSDPAPADWTFQDFQEHALGELGHLKYFDVLEPNRDAVTDCVEQAIAQVAAGAPRRPTARGC